MLHLNNKVKKDLYMSKKLIVLLFFICFIAKSEEVTLAYIDLYPHIYSDENNVTQGPLSTFLNDYIAPEMGVTFKLVKMPLLRIFKSMDDGEISGIAIAGFNKERNLKYTYPSSYTYSMQSALLTKKTHALKRVISPSDLKDLRIGYFGGGIKTPYIKNNKIELQKIYGLNVWKRNFQRLLKNRVDAVYSPSKLNLISLVKQQKLKSITNIITLPEDPIKLYTIFANSLFNEENNLINRYNNAFKKVDGINIYPSLLIQSSFSKS